jgi:hypothetical protein
MAITAEDILEQVRALPAPERLRLVERIVREVGLPSTQAPPLADMTDDEYAEFEAVLRRNRETQPLRAPK